MASSLGSLVVRLGLDAADYTEGLVKAEQQAAKFADTSVQGFRQLRKSADDTGKALDYLKEGFRGVIAAFGLREIARLSDEYQNVHARLSLVTASSEELARVQSTLLGISNETRTSFATSANLFYRVSQAARDLGTSQADVIKLIDGLNKALVVSGATGSTAKGAIEQLAQALGANQLRGQEFNTVNEQANRIMQALADGLGKTASELRQMANDGQITTQVFIEGFLKGTAKLNEEFEKVPITIGGAFQVAENRLQAFIGRLNDGAGGAGVLAKALLVVSNHLEVLVTAALTFGAVKLATKFQEISTAAISSATAYFEATAATRAKAAADVAAVEAELERLRATEATIVAARAQTQAELALTQALIAKGAVSRSFTASQISDLATLGKAQSDINRKTAEAIKDLEAAQQRAAAGTGLLGRAIGLLGGPIGATITVLGALISLWQLFGSTTEEENARAARSTETSTEDILAALRKQNDRLRERLALAKAGNVELAKNATPAGERAAKLLQEAKALRETNNIDRLNDTDIGKDLSLKVPIELTLPPDAQATIATLTEDERKEFLKRFEIPVKLTVDEQAARKEAAARALAEELRSGVLASTELEQVLGKQTIEEALKKYATNAEKAEAAINEMKKSLGVPANQTLDQAFPGGKGAELERRIRERFADKGRVAGEDASKQILQGEIQAIEALIAREKDIVRAGEDFLKDQFHDGFISTEQYYDDLQALRDRNLHSTLAFYDQEIAAAQGFAARQGATNKDRQDAENKIAEAQAKKTNILRDAGFVEQALQRDRRRDLEIYGDTLDEINAKILELSGNTAAAAKIRFDSQNRVLERTLKASGNQSALDQNDILRQQAIVVGQLNDQYKRYSIALGEVQLAQDAINFERNLGNIGEFTALQQLSDANQKRLAELREMAELYRVIAERSKDPSDLLKAKQLQQAVEQLSKQTDLLKDKFNNILGDAFVNHLQQLVENTESLKDAIKNFGKDVNSQIVKGIADEFKAKLFGQQGPLSGIGDFLSKLLGKGFGKGADIIQENGPSTPLPGDTDVLGDFLKKTGIIDATGKAADKAAEIAASEAATAALTTLSAGAETSTAGLTALGTSADVTSVAMSTFGTANEAAVLALTTMTTSASAAAAALASVAATSTASSASSIISGIGSLSGGPAFAASGTSYSFGGMTWVGEDGPELVNLPRGSQVVPNGQTNKWSATNGRAATQLFQTIVLPGANTQTARQASKMNADRMSYARRRG